MIATSRLAITTLAGLTLELTHSGTDSALSGNICATLSLPEPLTRHAAAGNEHRAAFLGTGANPDGAFVEPRLNKHAPPVLWIGHAAVDIDDTTAATAQAWLDSRPRPPAAALPTRELPADIAAPRPVERAA